MKGKITKNLRKLPLNKHTKQHKFKIQKPKIFYERQNHKNSGKLPLSKHTKRADPVPEAPTHKTKARNFL